MAKLILSMDGLVLKEIPLTKERTTLGRKPHNDIQIDNLAVSGEHAVIVTILNDSFLEDLGSTNGTVVNGNPVKKHFLQNNDVIELGKYKLKFIGEAAPAAGAADKADFEKTMVLRPSTMKAAAAAALACSVAARTWAGRSTIVFSKSALSPAATGFASPMNLSLYLPSSMTSLFCRKCFLIALPLTTVPLVLPRSSRKESFRIVTMTACSPLTARLSIWMSLWGLRPMVVRSFVKGISLRTSPSMESISFAISGPCGSLF